MAVVDEDGKTRSFCHSFLPWKRLGVVTLGTGEGTLLSRSPSTPGVDSRRGRGQRPLDGRGDSLVFVSMERVRTVKVNAVSRDDS